MNRNLREVKDYTMRYRAKWLIISVVLLVLNVVAGIAMANESDQKQTNPSQVIKWFPSEDVLTNVYHETLPKAEELIKAYHLSLQGSTADEAIKNIQQAIKICEDYIKTNPNDKEGVAQAYGIISYGYFSIGEFQTNDAEKLKSYEHGKDAAQKVIDLEPGAWDGWAWYSNNLGRISQLKGVIKSLFLLEPFKKHIFQAEKLSPNNPFILDAIGDMYRQLPWIAGGSMNKSKEYLEKAIKIDPHYTMAKLDLAITLLEDGKKEQAQSLLKEVVNADNPSWRSHWLIWEKPKAEALLNNIDNYKKLLDEWHLLI
ncbi:MAG: tetratricopeptide repeat protein [bacterium]